MAWTSSHSENYRIFFWVSFLPKLHLSKILSQIQSFLKHDPKDDLRSGLHLNVPSGGCKLNELTTPS